MSRLRRLFSFRSGGSVALVGGMVLTLLLVFWFAWEKWGAALTNQKKYQLELESITISKPPPWIHVDLKSVVYRDGSLGELSMLDRQLAVKVARAFELNPWVERVKWVRKTYPAQVTVELEYRRPVAMVEVRSGNEMGLFPVDAQGVLLDPRDFSENMTREFLRIRTDFSYPMGLVGTAWGKPEVTEAAAIAARLQASNWRDWGVHRIVAAGQHSGDEKLPGQYYLLTEDNLKIHWGHPPGMEAAFEPDADTKVGWLEELVRAKGKLSTAIVRGELDLRQKSNIKVIAPPRTPTRQTGG